MKKFNKIKNLADGHVLGNVWGCYYTKEADGLRSHQTGQLIRWKCIEHNATFLNTIDIL